MGIELIFKGEGIEEKAYVKKCNNPKYQLPEGKEIVAIDERYFRPTEVEMLLGDSSKAQKELDWELDYSLENLIEEMVASDLIEAQKDKHLKDGGFSIMNYYE